MNIFYVIQHQIALDKIFKMGSVRHLKESFFIETPCTWLVVEHSDFIDKLYDVCLFHKVFIIAKISPSPDPSFSLGLRCYILN